jgi:hypothetical protein
MPLTRTFLLIFALCLTASAMDAVTNATGVLRLVNSRIKDDFLGPRPHLELHPLPGQSGANLVVDPASASPRNFFELRNWIDEAVRVEGRLQDRLYDLLATNIVRLNPSIRIGTTNLNAAQAHAYAKKLARLNYANLETRRTFEDTEPPRLINDEWVWVWRSGKITGEEIWISFREDGACPSLYSLVFFSDSVPPPPVPLP